MRIVRALASEGWLVGTAGAAFVISYIWGVMVLESERPGAVLRGVAALAPALAFLMFIVAEVRALRGCDELQRRIQLEALAVAYPLAIAIVMVLSLLRKSGVGVEPKWTYLPITYFVGLAVAKLRYR